MRYSHDVETLLSDEILAQVHGGMNPSTTPDYRVEPRAMGGVMAAGAVTGALGGAAIGGIEAMPGAAGGALMAGAGYCVERLVNPPMVSIPQPMPLSTCHDPAPQPMPMAVCHSQMHMVPSHGRR
jgi:hypothetical protein